MNPKMNGMGFCSSKAPMQLLCYIVVAGLTISNLLAQTVCNRYGGDGVDFGFQLIEDPDGNWVMTGRSYSFSAPTVPVLGDLYTIKLSPSFDIIWTSVFQTQQQDEGYSIANAHDGGYMLAGASYRQASGFDITLVKLDTGGHMLWSKMLGTPLDERAQVIIPVSGNEYVIGGFSDSTFSGFSYGFVPFIARINSSGSVVWARRFGFGSGVFSGSVYDILEAQDGSLLVTGDILRLDDGPNDSDIFIARFSATGSLLWFQWMGTKCQGCQDMGAKLIEDDAQRFTMIGSSSPTGSIYIRSFDINGNLLLESGLQTGTFAFAKIDAVKADINRTVLTCPAYNNILVVSIDTLHQVEWSVTYGESQGEFPCSVLKHGSGYIVGGTSSAASPAAQDYFIAMLDSAGHSCCMISQLSLSTTTLHLPDSAGGSAHPFTLTEHTAGTSISGGKKLIVCPKPNAVKEVQLPGVIVYPNPFGEYIVIDLSGEAGAEIFIHNVGGLLVHYEAIPQGKNVIGLKNLPSGFYHLKISGNHGTTFVKLIKH